jgi:hypothetical protein
MDSLSYKHEKEAKNIYEYSNLGVSNSLDENIILSDWTSKLCSGLIINKNILKFSALKSLNISLEKPKKSINSKISLITSKSQLHSFLLENNIENSDKMMDFFNNDIPFIGSETKKLWDSQLETEFNQMIHFKIISQQIELTIQNSRPSDDLLDAVTKALNTQNPFSELEIIFNKYGLMLCQKVVLGGELSRTYHLSLKEPTGFYNYNILMIFKFFVFHSLC